MTFRTAIIVFAILEGIALFGFVIFALLRH